MRPILLILLPLAFTAGCGYADNAQATDALGAYLDKQYQGWAVTSEGGVEEACENWDSDNNRLVTCTITIEHPETKESKTLTLECPAGWGPQMRKNCQGKTGSQ